MDADRFDTLTSRLSTGFSRRRSLGLLATLSLPGLAAPAPVEAKKKKPCPPCKKRKKGKCKAALPDGTPCDGGTCQSGSCQALPVSPPPPFVCPPQRVCGPGCCPDGQVCGSNGACTHPSCCSGEAICGPHTSVGRLCCIEPRQARCCCDSPAGAGNGFVHCCMGAECTAPCPSGAPVATGGITGGPPGSDGICARGGDGIQTCPA